MVAVYISLVEVAFGGMRVRETVSMESESFGRVR